MKFQSITIPMVGASVLLVLPTFVRLPYDYFNLLRVVVCVTSLLTATAYANEPSGESRNMGVGFWVVVALLFNPIIPVRLNRGLWQLIDWIVAVVFWTLVMILRDEEKKQLQKAPKP